MGYRPDNPAGDALRRQQAVVQHPPLSTWGGEFPMTPQLKTAHFWADVSGGLDVLPVMPVGRFGLDEGAERPEAVAGRATRPCGVVSRHRLPAASVGRGPQEITDRTDKRIVTEGC